MLEILSKFCEGLLSLWPEISVIAMIGVSFDLSLGEIWGILAMLFSQGETLRIFHKVWKGILGDSYYIDIGYADDS